MLRMRSYLTRPQLSLSVRKPTAIVCGHAVESLYFFSRLHRASSSLRRRAVQTP